jgi:hypothetical protein
MAATLMTTTSEPKKLARRNRPSYCRSACKRTDTARKPCSFSEGMRDVNLPSFSFPLLPTAAAATTALRTVTYVGDGPATFTPRLTLPAGVSGTVTEASTGAGTLAFTAKGETKTFKLSVTAVQTAKTGWALGSLTWTDDRGRFEVYSQIGLQRGNNYVVLP